MVLQSPMLLVILLDTFRTMAQYSETLEELFLVKLYTAQIETTTDMSLLNKEIPDEITKWVDVVKRHVYTGDIDYLVLQVKNVRHVYQLSSGHTATGKSLITNVSGGVGLFDLMRGMFIVLVFETFFFAGIFPIQNPTFDKYLTLVASFCITRIIFGYWRWPIRIIMSWLVANFSAYTPTYTREYHQIEEITPWVEAIKAYPKFFFLDSVDYLIFERRGMEVGRIRMHPQNSVGKSLVILLDSVQTYFMLFQIVLYVGVTCIFNLVMR